MYIHLKDREYYEKLYDKHTIDYARRGIKYYEDFYKEIKEKMPKDDTIDRPGNVIMLNLFYMQTVGNDLLDRYDNRDRKIEEWMERDKNKDLQITDARLTSEPVCQHCKKPGFASQTKI
ncbi:hypothetical protein FWF93_02165 [Candidatus Saccharibacteria bacterium]|nr:hypothetical protein [Candidatus Saccharibacteria bacterium]